MSQIPASTVVPSLSERLLLVPSFPYSTRPAIRGAYPTKRLCTTENISPLHARIRQTARQGIPSARAHAHRRTSQGFQSTRRRDLPCSFLRLRSQGQHGHHGRRGRRLWPRRYGRRRRAGHLSGRCWATLGRWRNRDVRGVSVLVVCS